MSLSDGQGRMPSWANVRAFAAHAEAINLDSVWTCDHLLSGPPGRPPEDIHEGWTVLAALAASTSRVEIGTLVTCVSFRTPGLLAKMAVTVDAVSGGRLTLGLGAGWYDPEYEAFGYPTDDRVGRFEEALGIVRQLLRGDRVTVAGRYHQLEDAVLLPPAERAIPILIAGNGKRMLRLTARYAEAWNTAWYGLPDGRLRERLADLDRALEAEGRDPATLQRTVGVAVRDPDATNARKGDDTAFAGPADELARAIDGYEALGVDHLIVGLEPVSERSLDHLSRALSLHLGTH
jgi:probable F420-dependent oxidoreductase